LASLLQRRRSTEANQTLHDVWPSPGLVHYTHTFGGSCPVTEFCEVQNSLCVQVLSSPILAALLHGTRVVGVSQTLRRWAEGASCIRQDVYLSLPPSLGIGPHSSLFHDLLLQFYLYHGSYFTPDNGDGQLSRTRLYSHLRVMMLVAVVTQRVCDSSQSSLSARSQLQPVIPVHIL